MALIVLISAEEAAGARAVQQIAESGHHIPAVLTGGSEAEAVTGPVGRIASEIRDDIFPRPKSATSCIRCGTRIHGPISSPRRP